MTRAGKVNTIAICPFRTHSPPFLSALAPCATLPDVQSNPSVIHERVATGVFVPLANYGYLS